MRAIRLLLAFAVLLCPLLVVAAPPGVEPPSAYVQLPQRISGTAVMLAQKADQQGSVRVIVGVDAVYQPLGTVTSSVALAQQQRIRARQDVLLSRLAGQNIVEKARFRHVPFIALIADSTAVQALATFPEVISLEEDLPEPPDLSSSNIVIGSPDAWDDGYDGAGKVVAVLDTGVAKSHPYFSTALKVVSEACYSSNGSEIDSLCPGGLAESTDVDSGLNCAAEVNGCSHGTHVAGIAVGNDGIGPNYGVARGAGLIAIQVFTRFNSSGSCGGQAPCTLSYPSDQIRAMERVLVLSETYDVASVNLSLGGGRYYDEASCDAAQPSRKAAIDNLRGAGIVVAAASGNNGYRDSMNAPACISSAVAVGATTDTDLVSGFSNIADFVDLLAPGSSITSSVPGDGTATWSGTSMATPHVAGAWAVMQQFSPGGSVDAFLAVLRHSSEIVNDLRSGGTVTDMRRFNLDLALDVLGAPAPEFESDPEAEEMFDFGDVTVGAGSIDSTITVSNTGDADLTLSCALSGANAGSFTIGQCPEPIAPATDMDVTFSCTPISGGTLVASLDFTTNDIDETLVSFTLNCNGLGPEFVSAPSPAAVFDFEVVEIDTVSPELTLQLGNIGTANLNLGCVLGGDDPGSFSVSPCPASLGPGGNVILDLSCQPTTLGNLSATLDLTTNDFDEGSVSYSLVCNSVPLPAPEFDSVPVPDSVFDFEDVDVGATSDFDELQVSNLGGADMTVSCDISGDDADQFSLVQCPDTVASQENITVSFSCDPTSFGNKSASLDLTTNDADETDVSYGLLCNGLAPEFESSPPGGAVIDFGDVVVGADGIYFQLDVDNLGTAGLTLACVLSGADTDAFNVSQCPPSVDPQSSVEITLICVPPDIGEKAASLDLTTNDEDEGSVSYDLACQGIDDLLSRNGFETTE